MTINYGYPLYLKKIIAFLKDAHIRFDNFNKLKVEEI